VTNLNRVLRRFKPEQHDMRVTHGGLAGPIFICPFTAIALTTAGPVDLFFIANAAAGRLAIREVRLGQYTEFGDAQAELFSIQLMTGTTSTAVGTALSPQNVRQHTGASTAAFSVAGPSTPLSSTASAALRMADAWNVAARWFWRPAEDERPVLNASQKAVLRLASTPNDAITLNGTLTLQALGQG
jgi:hypothetical protein